MDKIDIIEDTHTIRPIPHKRCQAIKKNGRPCRQVNRPNQGGGEIINGYCHYHKHLRKEDKVTLTTMN